MNPTKRPSTPDPVDRLLAMVDRIQRRTPRCLPGELWEFTAILLAVQERRSDYVASLNTSDQALFHLCLDAALRGFQDACVH